MILSTNKNTLQSALEQIQSNAIAFCSIGLERRLKSGKQDKVRLINNVTEVIENTNLRENGLRVIIVHTRIIEDN